ncbi:hypothetical protein [Novosphingobium soli]|uniref:Amidase n=1 Tax=Novosphingobium soli TaxID=574956 RepID=A0ABV6CTI0_9SPHN
MAEIPAAALPEAPGAAVPLSADAIAAAASARGLTISPECEPGVAANLALLARHARVMRGQPTETQA